MKQTAFCGEQKRDYAACLKSAVNFMMTKDVKWIFKSLFLCMFTFNFVPLYNNLTWTDPFLFTKIWSKEMVYCHCW
jgi:hypothetical protein